METLGDFLRVARKDRALTLGQLSLHAGVNKATLSRWETGTFLPRIPELGRVFDALEIPAARRDHALRLFHTPRAIVAARSERGVTLQVSLGDMLYGLRVRSGKSQETIARATGVSRSLLVHWESDDCAPSDAQLHATGFALGATADELTALSTRRFAAQPVERSRDAVLHTLAMTAHWDEHVPGAVYRLMLMSFLAFLSREQQRGKADPADLALLFTKFGESAEFVTGDKHAAARWHERARVCAVQAAEPIYFHVISSLRALLDEKTSPKPLSERVATALEWKPKFKTNAGKAYLLSVVAGALAQESPDRALRMADEYCILVKGDADEYPCRLRDKGNLLYKCGRFAESVAFISKLAPQDSFRAGLQQLEMAKGLIALGSVGEARRCVDAGKRLLSPVPQATARTLIGELERATS